MSIPWVIFMCISESGTAMLEARKLVKMVQLAYENEGICGGIRAIFERQPKKNLQWELVPGEYKFWANRRLQQVAAFKIHALSQATGSTSVDAGYDDAVFKRVQWS